MALYQRWFVEALANRVAKTALRCLPILAVAFLLPPPFRLMPPAFMRLGVFLLSAILSLGVVVSFSMIIYTITFYTLSPTGPRIVASVLADFMAGATIPLPFFPEPFRSIAELLPFAAMQNMPLRIYSGNIAGAEALRGIILQLFWFIILTVTGKAIMKRALNRVVIQGG
jgi:ABC-2 type transport system permease protein